MSEPQEEPIPLDRLTRVYLKIKAKMQQETSVYEAKIEEMKKTLQEVSNAMKDHLQALKSTSVKTPEGTVILSNKTRYYAQDWDAMKTFIIEHEALDLLERRIAQTAMQTFLDENPGVVPPGLNSVSEIQVSVRKPTAK